MLGLFGLLGALLAGLVADSMIGGMMSKSDEQGDDSPHPPPDPQEETHDQGSILDWLVTDPASVATPDDMAGVGPDDPDYVPQSSDMAMPADADLVLNGHDGDDLLSGLNGDDTLVAGEGDDQRTHGLAPLP